ncbi:g11175 [Coccomyxa viridis]|uniref:G11175 protein n=1 Tax=Coccomyxa viridis TaxID=1274662 RepID=A0ABP1G7M9_9CHLO
MAKRVGAQPKPGLAKYALALLLVPLVVALQRDHSARAHVHAGSVDPEGHLRQLIEHRDRKQYSQQADYAGFDAGAGLDQAEVLTAGEGEGEFEGEHRAGHRAGAHHSKPGGGPAKPLCKNFGQLPKLTGEWVDHPDPQYRGIYSQKEQCPAWGQDFNCIDANSPEEKKPKLIAKEYRKIFRPHECDLPEWDAVGFDKCMKGRKIIMIGDSLTWQMYNSLACLLAPVTADGFSTLWENANTTVTKNYKGREWPEDRHILKQYWADVKLGNGGEIHVRCFGRYNASLWDDVFAELPPLTAQDVIIINFGAWYPRFNFNEPRLPWESFQLDIRDLFVDKLSKSPAQAYWRTNSPTHFGGATGTFTAIEEPLEGVPVRERCDPASVGEYWFREHVVHTLKECGPACSNIRMLPIYDLSLSRHNSHHGTFGRGKETGYTDCRHYCVNVIDWWNVVLYAMMCF